MDALWVFDATTTELKDKLTTLVSQGARCRHLVHIIEEELQERLCHAELKQLLQHEVLLEQDHNVRLDAQHTTACGSNAADSLWQHCPTVRPAAWKNQLQAQISASAAVLQPYEHVQAQQAVHVPQDPGPDGCIQEPQHSDARECKPAAQPRQLDVLNATQQCNSRLIQQPQQQQQALTPLHAAQRAFLEEQQRIRKAQVALHKSKRVRGRPAATRKPQLPSSSVESQYYANLQASTQQHSIVLQHLQRHSPAKCKQQHDKWHTVTCSPSAVRHAVQKTQKQQQQQPAMPEAAESTAQLYSAVVAAAEHIPAASTSPCCGVLHQARRQHSQFRVHRASVGCAVPSIDSAVIDPAAAPPAQDSQPSGCSSTAATCYALVETAAPPAAALADSCSATDSNKAEAPASSKDATPVAMLEAAEAASCGTAAEIAANDQLPQEVQVTTNGTRPAENAAARFLPVCDKEGTAPRANIADQQLPLQWDALTVVANCTTPLRTSPCVQQRQQHVHLSPHDRQQRTPAAASFADDHYPDVAHQHRLHPDDSSIQAKQQQQQQHATQIPAAVAAAAAAAAVLQDTLSEAIHYCHLHSPLSLDAKQSCVVKAAEPVQHVQAVYNSATGKAGIHQPLQLDSWKDWDAMAKSIDDSHDGFGAWGAANGS